MIPPETHKSFWLLYLFYGIELVQLTVLSLPLVAPERVGLSVDDFRDGGVVPYAVLLLILAAPVLIGFWTRNYFVRGLWTAYGWIVALSAVAFLNDGPLTFHQVVEKGFVLIYPTVLSLVLMFSNTARTYFNRTVFKTGAERTPKAQKKAALVFQKGRKVDVDAFLEMRLAKSNEPVSTATHQGARWALAFWTGGYIAVGGYLTDISIVLEFGLMTLVLGFIWGRIALAAAKANQ